MLIGDSLRLRLPLLIGVLIAAVLASFLWVTNYSLQRIMERTGGEQLRWLPTRSLACWAGDCS